jgi:uncharacterized metal-binding protein
MVHTILPIVYGERLRSRRSWSLWSYALGSLLGAIMLGTVLGFFGASIHAPLQTMSNHAVLFLAIGMIHVAVAGHELGFFSLPLPQSRWQVPRQWLGKMPWPAATLAYGLALGAGVLTRINASPFYLLLAGSIALGHPWLAVLAFGTFGIGRVLPMLAFFVVAQDDFELARWHTVVDRWFPTMKVLTGLGLALWGGVWLGIAARPDAYLR